MRKTNSNAVLKNLPEADQAIIEDWLLEGMSYAKVRELIAAPRPEGFGLTVSRRMIGEFWEDVVQPMLLERQLVRRRRGVESADKVGEEIARQPGRFSEAAIDAIKQKAFEVVNDPRSAPEEVIELTKLILKIRDQDQNTEKLQLEKAKFLETIKTNLDRGLDALHAEIQHIPAALELFHKFRALVQEATAG